jgi:hypothetical protein
VIALLLLFYPPFGSQLTPGGDGPEHHLFADRKGKRFDVATGKVHALVATGDPLLGATGLDRADTAKEKDIVRKTTPAMQFFECYSIVAGQLLLQLEVIVPVGDVDRAHPAVQTARRGQFALDFHHDPPLKTKYVANIILNKSIIFDIL